MPKKKYISQASEQWDSMSHDQKEDFVRAVISDILEDYGYDNVDVVFTSLDDAYGIYDPDTGTIYIDNEQLDAEAGFSETLDTAYHEAAHAMQDEAYYDDTDDYPDSYEDIAEQYAEAMVDRYLNEALGLEGEDDEFDSFCYVNDLEAEMMDDPELWERLDSESYYEWLEESGISL